MDDILNRFPAEAPVAVWVRAPLASHILALIQPNDVWLAGCCFCTEDYLGGSVRSRRRPRRQTPRLKPPEEALSGGFSPQLASLENTSKQEDFSSPRKEVRR